MKHKKKKDIFDLIEKPKNYEENRILARVRNAPSINSIERQIRKEGLYKIKVPFMAHAFTIDGDLLRNHYYSLIGNKLLKNDKKLMNDIIQFREKILKHRISCEVYLFEKGTIVAGLKIYKILVEEGQDIADFWFGKTIDPSSFKVLINNFVSYMNKYGISTINIIQMPMRRCTIDEISTEFEFS